MDDKNFTLEINPSQAIILIIELGSAYKRQPNSEVRKQIELLLTPVLKNVSFPGNFKMFIENFDDVIKAMAFLAEKAREETLELN